MTARTRYASAGGVSLSAFLVYLATLSPATSMWDAGEYIAAAKTLGIPHQPGNPMYSVIAHAFGLLPLSSSYDVRVNILAALCSALTAGFWFLCAERLLRDHVVSEVSRLLAAAGAALLGAWAFTVWNQSVVMEKVYPIALLGLAIMSWLMMLWLDKDENRESDRLLVLVTYLVGLTYAVHPAGLLTAPAVGAAVAVKRPKTLLRWKLMALLPVAFFAGTTPFAVLPIRAAYQPYINESAISACEKGNLEASCAFNAETIRRLKGTIEREQYGGNAVLQRRGPFVAQVQMFWLYFKWQWMRDLNGQFVGTQTFVAACMLVLGILGLTLIGERNKPHFAFYGVLAGSFTLALIYYLNFRYGFSQSLELGMTVEREPRDRDYFYMWTFSLWGLLAGLGMVSLLRRRAWLVVVAAALPLVANWSSASRRGMEFTPKWAADVLNSMEPNAIIITQGDNDSFPLWHAQAVNGIRPDITIALVPYLGMEWYARQLNQRSPIWKLTDAELDTIPPFMQFDRPIAFTHNKISATIPAGYLMRDQLLVLRAIKDSFPARPLYFTFGGYATNLGLNAFTKRIGLVHKLMPEQVKEDANTALVGGMFVDIDKSLALWRSYKAPPQLFAEGRWIDKSTNNIPIYYAAIGQDLAVALEARGRTAEAKAIMDTVRRVVDMVQ